MDARIVQAFPVLKLWRDGRDLSIRRLREILRDEVDDLISADQIQLIVAQPGAPLLWILPQNISTFWKRTRKSAYYHTVSFDGQKPDFMIATSYLFYPSVWESLDGMPVVLLEGIFWPASVHGAPPS